MMPGTRLRVLHVGKFYPPVSGGMERVLQLLCEREKTAVDTRVLVANTQRSTVHETINGVDVTRVANAGSAGSVAVCPSLPLWLSRARADVIVIHEPNPMGLLAYALARPAGRLIVWFHSEVVRDRWKYALMYRPWFAHAMRRASRVIVASPPMIEAEQLRGFSAPAAVIPYGVDEGRLALSPEIARRAAQLRDRHRGPLVLFVGRLVPYKGLGVLLRAMVDVPATAVLVGGGPQRAALEALARELGIASRVVFAGEVDEPGLVAWYHACDLFVLPSTTRAEAFGVVQTEAMACGKPVVSTALPSGVPWVNRDGETGLVVPPGDTRALAAALMRLAGDAGLRQRMGDRGRLRVLDEFTANRMALRAVEMYHAVVSEPVAGLPVAAAVAGGVSIYLSAGSPAPRLAPSIPAALRQPPPFRPLNRRRSGSDVMLATHTVDAILAAIIRGDGVEPPAAGDSGVEFIEAATRHGLRALVADRLGPGLAQWPLAVGAALAREPVLGAALDTLRQRELRLVLEELARRGVSPLLMKGSALAYTLYANPAHRPRFDTDLLVRREDMETVAEVMSGRGYLRPNQVTGELVMHQIDYARKDSHGVWHVYDFHWKVANRQAVASVLSFGELARDGEPVAALGPHARGLSRVHALLLACVHRLAHHPSEDRLIWIYDIHLLAEGLSAAEVESFGELAVDRSVTAVCADGLAAAVRWFDTRVPEGLLERLTAPRAAGAPEPSAAFLAPPASRIDEMLSDLRALRGWSRRARLVYEHAFPPPSYITGMYTVSNRAWLPALYTHRIVRGVWRWIRSRSR